MQRKNGRRARLYLAVGIAAALGAAWLTGCAGTPRTADLGSLYSRSAKVREDDRTPVIVVPGILGSILKEPVTGRVVWGAFSGEYANPQKPEDAALLALPMADGKPLSELRDRVRVDGALDRVKVNLLGIPISLTAYYEIMQTLGVGGFIDRNLAEAGAIDYGTEHYTCFQYGYDWRRDIAEAAAELADQVDTAIEIARLNSEGPRPDLKVNIVAHSMGGMVARYYLMYGREQLPDDGSLPPLTWAGAKNVHRLIMVGTPNAGSALALTQLVNGFKAAPFLPRYSPALLGTMPAIYQLLPRERHHAIVDAATGEPVAGLFDPAAWEQRGWGLADPDQAEVLAWLLPDVTDPAARRAIALDHLGKCLRRAEQLHRALDVPATPPPGLIISLIAGDAEPTLRQVRVAGDTGRLVKGEMGPGDGTVLRSSALMDEREGTAWSPRLHSPIEFDHVMFLFRDHIGLTKDPAFADNVLFQLLELPPPGAGLGGPAGPASAAGG